MTEEEVEKKRQEIKFFQEQYDQANNQEFFKPKISQYETQYNTDRKLQGYKSVFEALHHEAKILNDKKQNLKDNYQKQTKLISQQYIESKKCPNSEAILLKVHRERLSQLFQALDHDYDGYISAAKISIASLSNELLDVLTPLLLKIEEHSLQLDFEQFVQIVMDFSKYLSHPDKALLLGAERELFKSPQEQHPFTPALTANTRAIMEYANSENRKVHLWEDTRERTIGDKENDELQECTFHPQILDYKPGKFKKGIKSRMDLKETIIHTMSNC